ncbi:MAG TPA: XRE family transcriptional regulator [Solirubrobacteraceae bacterium]|nr:XRE family transcriptional regulator [Solirubrobacteraceae bacterium]
MSNISGVLDNASTVWEAPSCMSAKEEPTLGSRLRELRTQKNLSLRDVERLSGVNSGYLSQLERDEIASPGPSTLQKLAAAYEESVTALMLWAGYIEEDPSALAPNTKRALSMLGDDVTEDELRVMKAVLDTLRNKTGFGALPHRTDRPLTPEDRTAIRGHAVSLLREIDALRSAAPVDLGQAYATARLVQVGAIELTPEERRGLRQRFGDLVDGALKRLLGVLHTDSRQVYVKADLHALKKRFVLGHEAGHAVLPDHQALFAHLDDKHRLAPEFNDLLERQANQFAAELLAKGDRLREQFDDSTASARLIGDLSDDYLMSRQAVARRVAEESRQDIAIAMSWRAFQGQGHLMPPKLYCSPSFEVRMRWRSGRAPADEIRSAVKLAASGATAPPILTTDALGRPTEVSVEGLDALYSVIALFRCEPSARRRASFLRRV